MAQEPPDAKKLAAFGLELDDFAATDIVNYWPEHEQAVKLFLAMQTQWRVGFGGLVGLDYNALQHPIKALGISDAEFADVFNQLQVIEYKYLQEKQPAE